MKKVIKILYLFCAVLLTVISALPTGAAFRDENGQVIGSVVPPPDGAFTDIDNEPPERREAILMLQAYGITDGYPDGTFRPERFINRGEFVKLLIKALQKDCVRPPWQEDFPDVNTDKFYYDYANIARSLGYMDGYSDGCFHGERLLTRQQISKIVGTILESEIEDLKDIIPDSPEDFLMRYYEDFDKIISKAIRPVAALVKIDIIQPNPAVRTARGKDLFGPEDPVSRGEMAEILYRMYNKLFVPGY